MGYSAKVILFYGVILKDGAVEPYQEGEEEDGATVTPAGPEEGPSWLAYSGKDEDGVTVVALGHYDEHTHAVAIAATVKQGRDWTPLAVRTSDMASAYNDRLAAFLTRWRLTKQVNRRESPEPGWYAAPCYW